MSSQRKIEVNQSSLLSLKAELLRKKQEVHDAKLSEYPNKPTVVRKVKTKLERANKGVSERDSKDAEEIEDEKNILQKSQSALEAKSKLYDELLKNPESVDSSSNILVDFSKKEKSKGKQEVQETVAEESEDDFVDDLVDDEEWVDFVDCLGRTKRCHRDDLESMRESDERLRLSLFGRSAAREQNSEAPEKEPKETKGEPDLCCEDMRRKMLREKWEEEERMLSDRRDIHYQHVLFDEARTHGVGYYSFSTDEAERARQLKDLDNLRKETVEQQAVAKEIAKRKKKQMEERLRAARRRKRERLGLPLDEEPEETNEEEEEPAKPEPLKREEQISSTMRPWDVGKRTSTRILTQEEWIEKKREERPEEFAPPQSLEKNRWKKRRKSEEASLPEAYLEDISLGPENRPAWEQGTSNEKERRTGVEIPPPPTFELFGPSSKKPSQPVIPSDIERSIEEGLNFIRKQVEEKQMKKAKGSLDIF